MTSSNRCCCGADLAPGARSSTKIETKVAPALEVDEGAVDAEARPWRGRHIEQIDPEVLGDGNALVHCPGAIGVEQHLRVGYVSDRLVHALPRSMVGGNHRHGRTLGSSPRAGLFRPSTPCLTPAYGGWVYIMANRRDGTLYVGVASDLPRRVYQHRESLMEGFTKRYGLKMLVYYEQYDDIRVAIQREKTMKHWPRAWKVRLIHQMNPDWEDLYSQLF